MAKDEGAVTINVADLPRIEGQLDLFAGGLPPRVSIANFGGGVELRLEGPEDGDEDDEEEARRSLRTWRKGDIVDLAVRVRVDEVAFADKYFTSGEYAGTLKRTERRHKLAVLRIADGETGELLGSAE